MSLLKRIAREESKLEMTPMIDVTFLLLIFFMCTIKFKTLEGKLSAFLPSGVGVNPTEAEPEEKTMLRIEILNEGTRLDARSATRLASRDPQRVARWDGQPDSRYVFGEDRVVRYQTGPRKTQDVNVLARRLEELYQSARSDGVAEPALTIDPGRGVVYEDFVVALDQAVKASFTDISFLGVRED